ncbi:hypothetical protein QTP86_023758, partial [Hemibagrus guttatus]
MSTFRAQHLSSAEKEDERRSCRTLTPCQMSVSFSRIRDERTLSALAPVGNSADTPLSNPPIKLDRFQPTHTHNGKGLFMIVSCTGSPVLCPESPETGSREPVPISGVIGHQGKIHPGRSANPSQGTHTYSLIHSHNLEMPINLQCMSLDWGRKPEHPEETPKARGEHANSTHTAEVGIEPPTLE